MNLLFFLFFSIITSQEDLDSNSVNKVTYDSSTVNQLENFQNLQTNQDSLIGLIINSSDTNEVDFYKFELNDIFYEQLIESKLTFADAITYDIALDTIEAQVQFETLFASFEFLDSLSLSNEYKRIEYNIKTNYKFFSVKKVINLLI